MTELEKSLKAAEEKEFWEPTMILKWKIREVQIGIRYVERVKDLQQQWISDRGNFEWRDIEVE